MPIIDVIFLFLSMSVIIVNVFLVILIGDQEVRINEIVRRFAKGTHKYFS